MISAAPNNPRDTSNSGDSRPPPSTRDGGGGNDVFVYNDHADADTGESVQGGSGTDTIRIAGDDTCDLRVMQIQEVETLAFSVAASAILGAGQLGA